MRTIFFLLCLLLSSGLWGQDDKTTLTLSHQTAVPLGAFRSNFMDRNSFRGLQVDMLHHASPRWRIGLGVGYQDFYRKWGRESYGLEDGSRLSAVRSHSLQTIPVLLKAQYYPLGSTEAKWQPYVQAGAGANVVQVQQLYGEFDNVNDVRVGFGAQLGAGMKYMLNTRTAFTSGMVYNHLPFRHHGIGSVSHLGFQLGFRFTLRNHGGGWNNGWNGGGRAPRHYRMGGWGW